MNYKVISDEQKLLAFIDWLPELERHEKFYCCLFARKKYCPDGMKSNDKAQLKRFLTDKKRLFQKIKQLEVATGAYHLKNEAVPQVALAMYINPNPRDLKKATYDGIIKLTELLKHDNKNYNPHSEMLNCIQRSNGRNIFLDFDVDTKDFDFAQLRKVINPSALQIVETRGGYHVLVKLSEVEPEFKKSFYRDIVDLGVDQTGDQLLPMPGCFQGGYTPKFV